jgi:chloramphenicol 3-O phosphotransferase
VLTDTPGFVRVACGLDDVEQLMNPGQIVVLNGAPRAGKSSIVAVIQETFNGPWMNLGVDAARQTTPPRCQPGIGLRPGETEHEAAPFVPTLYAAWYESIAAHSRAGLNVVVDVAHHDAEILADCARRLEGLPVLFVGVRCPIEVIMERRNAGQPGREGMYATGSPENPVPEPVALWQRRVHVPGIYDLEVDTSVLSPEECADAIGRRLQGPPPSAFPQLAKRGAGADLKRHVSQDGCENYNERVEPRGLEPLASAMPWRRSPN